MTTHTSANSAYIEHVITIKRVIAFLDALL